MVALNSPELSKKVRSHIKTMVQGNGGMKAVYSQIDDFLSWSNNYFKHNPYLAAKEYVTGGAFLVYTVNIEKEIRKWGITDKQMDDFSKKDIDGRMLDGSADLYFYLMAKEIAQMYSAQKTIANAKKTIKEAKRRL